MVTNNKKKKNQTHIHIQNIWNGREIKSQALTFAVT